MVPMPAKVKGPGDRPPNKTRRKKINDADLAIKFIETLKIPEGPNAGKPLKLAPFQKKFVRGALAKDNKISVLSIGRGNAKTALSSAIALGAFLGEWDTQPNRLIVLAARSRDQGAIAFDFAVAFLRSLPEDVQSQVKVRRSPRLELEIFTETGSHILRVISSDGRTALGSAPTLVLLDERGHWDAAKGDELEAALLSGLGKRSGKALIISTSAADDSHPFSTWCDVAQEGVYIQEHRPAPGLPADDLASIKEANPGAVAGIGADLKWLQAEARRAIRRGGSTLTNYRLFNRNERVADETRDVLLTTDQWLDCETDELPPRKGQVIVGADAGGSASMSCVAFYWPDSGRLETYGTFPSSPSLQDRGAADGVKTRYVEMHKRGELNVLGNQTVPLLGWLEHVSQMLDGQPIAAFIADRFKQAEMSEALVAANIRCPVIWRGMGYRDGSEDVERFRRFAFEGKVLTAPSLLMRSAIADAVVLRDPANNSKLAKGRSKGRIDAVAAAVLAVAQGARMLGQGNKQKGRLLWV